MKHLYFILFILFSSLIARTSFAQGCVAIRHFSGCSTIDNAAMPSKGDLQFNANYRYFKSFRHFRGNHEEPERVLNNTEVINWSHALDLNFNYFVTNRVFATFTLPLVYNKRSSLYEHGGNALKDRRATYSQGISDVRIGAGYWLLPADNKFKGNISVGAAVKLPTGNYGAVSTFYNVGPEGAPMTRPVDQSIQPGDGGYGLALDFQFFKALNNHLGVYAGGFYLINPRETNGTLTYRRRANEAIMSVPDQYAFRAGGMYHLPKGIAISLGGRLEGIPVYDLVGGSAGFRRPGYIVSVEPGIVYGYKDMLFTLNVPYALIRNRTQSVTDKENTQLTGEYVHGDSAFADYLISVGVNYRIRGFVKPRPEKPEWQKINL